MPIAVPASDHVLETDPFFSFHHINAYEVEGTPQIVVDTAAMDGGIDFSLSMENGSEAIYQRLAGRAILTRLVLDLSTSKVMPDWTSLTLAQSFPVSVSDEMRETPVILCMGRHRLCQISWLACQVPSRWKATC